ncbi:multidrug transporter AcrB [Desulfolithobacter dissulfuricans]|uniref:Multidrug transporter AcrB n=1 Tax=Desulfolithobacter dissulfuricans TaxID=2795293 RepID=A0A915TZC7_9BACT|nr:efflux RND transporter permease subunit [Desulfolithobacter dissulfuricans]BCO08079.1 multidrug transporter AcrB [Desulfolithobacter dissulfuricans]
MTGLVRFTLKQKVFCNLFFVLLMVIGAYAMLRSSVERYPNIHFGKVMIDTYFPGASPGDVEALVTRVIEDALENMNNVEYILSHSYRERSSILIKFIDDTDYQRGYDEVRFRVQTILSDLPDTVDPPRFNELDVNDWFPAISVNIVGERSNRALILMAEDLKTRLLARVPDLKEVKLVGEFVREFHVLLDQRRMRSLGVTFDQAARALSRANITVPAGAYDTPGGEFMLRVDERFRSRTQVMDTIIRRDGDGSFIRIRDIVAHPDAPLPETLSYRQPFVMSSINGQDCVSLQLIKTRQGNAIQIAAETRKVVEENRDRYREEGIELVVTQDSTVKIKDSMRVLGTNLLLGIILVCILIWSVMGLRNAALTTVGIPFSFMVTMAIMYLTGNSINEISLFAFVLVSGIIVDDAIVVVENIYRHVQQGKKLHDAVKDGTAEVFLPVVSATLTTVAAFLPMLIMTGSTGEFFAVIPKAVTYALIASLLECLFILPVHYLDFGQRETQAKTRGRRFRISGDGHSLEIEDTRFMAFNRALFNYLLERVLIYRKWSLLLLFLLFSSALFIALVSLTGRMNLIRVSFFPDDYSIFYVEVTGPAGTSINTTHELVKKIAAEVMADGPGMATSAAGIAGFYLNEDYYPVWGSQVGHVVVTLPAIRERQFEDDSSDILLHLDSMRRKLAHFSRETGFRLHIRPEKDGPPAGKDINIRILGRQRDRVQEAAARAMDFLRHDPDIAPWLIDLQDDQGQPGRVLRFAIRPERIMEYNLTPDQVALLAASLLNGRVVGKYRLEDEEIDLKLKLATSPEHGLKEALAAVAIDHPDGPVLLGDLVEPKFSVEPGFLNRFQGLSAVTLTADLRPESPVSSQSVIKEVRAWFKSVQDQYPGVSLNFAGEYESTHRSYTSLTYAFFIALTLIYLILAAQFGSYTQPLIIISAVIFALIGVIYGTFLSRSLFTINSFIAIVGVTGVVVNDSLVLVDFINKAYQKGLTRHQAIVAGTNIRLRPIILTTLTTTLGLLPMALGIPEYSLVWGTMAMTFVTGLCTATFLTIIIVPVEWDMLMAAAERRTGTKNKKISGPGRTRIHIEQIHD